MSNWFLLSQLEFWLNANPDLPGQYNPEPVVDDYLAEVIQRVMSGL